MIGYSKRFHTIVAGVGGMGSATVYEMAKRGKRVLGLEKFDIPHDLGSSHGYTRIIRLAYYEHPSYVMLLKRAYELWDELEYKTGRKVLYKTGSIDAGPADSWVFKGSLKSVVEHGLEHDVLSGKQMKERWPGYQLPDDHMAIFQPQGGFLLPEQSIMGYVDAAHSLGAEIHGREEVLGYEPLSDGVRVFTNRAEYEADRLVITAGAWNRELLPFLGGFAVPERQVLAWMQPEKPKLFTPENFPVFNLLVDEGRYYGFPVHGIPGFKIGKYHHFQEQGDVNLHGREPTMYDEEMLREVTDRYFPDAAGPTMTLKACQFTNSPDGHFIMGLHPELPQVSYCAGFTGHGYKFASVIGEVMADLAERLTTRHDISLFQLDRLYDQGLQEHLLDPAYEDREMLRANTQHRLDVAPNEHRALMRGRDANMHMNATARPYRRSGMGGVNGRGYRRGGAGGRGMQGRGMQRGSHGDPRQRGGHGMGPRFEDDGINPFW